MRHFLAWVARGALVLSLTACAGGSLDAEVSGADSGSSEERLSTDPLGEPVSCSESLGPAPVEYGDKEAQLLPGSPSLEIVYTWSAMHEEYLRRGSELRLPEGRFLPELHAPEAVIFPDGNCYEAGSYQGGYGHSTADYNYVCLWTGEWLTRYSREDPEADAALVALENIRGTWTWQYAWDPGSTQQYFDMRIAAAYLGDSQPLARDWAISCASVVGDQYPDLPQNWAG